MPVRTIVAWCPDWPLVAAGADAVASAVVHANRVIACSAPARASGVRRGLRRREAQARCPGLEIVPHDPARDARAFEPVAAAVESFAPAVEIVRPGMCALGAKGPARYFGGELALAELIAEAAGHGCAVGIADGMFAASLAARIDDGVVVPPGETPGFLAGFGVEVLDRPELAGLLVRLGIRTLGAFAALPAPDVLGRFGEDAAAAHRLARGLDERPLLLRTPPRDMSVHAELDPPADRVDRAAFHAKALADQLHERLDTEGLACTRIRIEAETEHGETLSRLWRHDGGLSAQAVADRVRWQLDGWLTARAAEGGTTGALTVIRLIPDELKPNTGRQRGFWGSETEADERAGRAFARIQGMLGPHAVRTAVLSGGRDPAEQATLVAWGDVREPQRPGLPGEERTRIGGWHTAETPPWPGRLPGPAPTTVYPEPLPATVTDASGRAVQVSGRGLISAAPARVAFAGRTCTVTAWAGPWPADERWWDPDARRRRARFQMLVDGGRAHLLALQDGRWHLEASYD